MRCSSSVCSRTKELSIFNIYERDIFDIPSIHNVHCKNLTICSKAFFWLTLHKHNFASMSCCEWTWFPWTNDHQHRYFIFHLLASFPQPFQTRPFVQHTSPVNNKEGVIFHHSHRVISCYPSITMPNDDHCANVDHMVWLIPAHVVQWNVWSVIDGMGMQPLESQIRWWGSTDTPFGMSGMARAWPFLNKSTI